VPLHTSSSGTAERPRRPASVAPAPPVLAALRPLWDVDASGWFAYGTDGRLAYVNRAFQRLTASRPRIGSTDLVPDVSPERRLAIRRAFHRLRAGDDTASSWVVPVVVNGALKPLHLSLTAIADPPQRANSVVGVATPVMSGSDTTAAGEAERVDLLEQVLGRVMNALSTVFLDEDVGSEVLEREDLSARQREVLHLLLRGDRPSAVAAALHLSTHTVRNYEKAIFRKLGVHSQSELISLARAMRRHPSVRGRAATDAEGHGS
jgi:DNA-binding CsgD family transcriptional regulator